MNRKIVSSRLTTCEVVKDGHAVRLDLMNEAGHPVSLEMSIEQAQSLVMTLPRLVSKAVKVRTGNPHSRYAFPMAEWKLETTAGEKCLLLTLTTPDGFEVTFGIPFSKCQRLGSALTRHGEAASEGNAADGLDCSPVPVLN
jgi:hypothetical protein